LYTKYLIYRIVDARDHGQHTQPKGHCWQQVLFASQQQAAAGDVNSTFHLLIEVLK
jgi:hypothetical protein